SDPDRCAMARHSRSGSRCNQSALARVRDVMNGMDAYDAGRTSAHPGAAPTAAQLKSRDDAMGFPPVVHGIGAASLDLPLRERRPFSPSRILSHAATCRRVLAGFSITIAVSMYG